MIGMDIVQLGLNIKRLEGRASAMGMSRADVLTDIVETAKLHKKGQSTDGYFKSVGGKSWQKRKNLINAIQGLNSNAQRGINPVFDKMGMNTQTGTYRTFAYDRVDGFTDLTGDMVIPYGNNAYYTLKANLMPQAPRINVKGEIVKDAPNVRVSSIENLDTEIPLGFNRKPVIDTRLQSLSDDDFWIYSRDINSKVDKLEGLWDDNESLINDRAFRKKLATSQDEFSAMENENFRRSIEHAPSEDIAYEFRQLKPWLDDDKVKMAILINNIGRRGLMEEMRSFLTEYAKRSPDHAEILSSKMEDAARVVREMGDNQRGSVEGNLPTNNISYMPQGETKAKPTSSP
jgi:hypothetical protein